MKGKLYLFFLVKHENINAVAYASVILTPQSRGRAETFTFCSEKPCQNPTMRGQPVGKIIKSTAVFPCSLLCFHYTAFLAHLSQRLIGELIGYPWSGVRPSVVNNFKRLLLQNRWSDQNQILCGASLGRGNDILFAASGSHDQDGRHAHIW